MFPFVAINLATYIAAIYCCSSCAVMDAGFPYRWYVGAWVGGGMIWEGFFFDIMLAVTASVISGRVLQSILQPND